MPCYASSCGRVVLYHGDCETMERIKADALVSDPPYGIGWDVKYNFGLQNSSAPHAKNLKRKKHPKIHGDDKPFDPSPWLDYPVVVLWGANNFSDRLPQGSWLVWDKRDAMENAFMSEAEAAWMNRGKSIRLMKHCWQGFSRASENSEHYHPTQKPIRVMGWCMEQAKVPEGATVLDPYMGSGSTGVACLRTGRRFIGIEKDPAHYATAVQRIKRELSQGDLFHSQHNV
jgi:hypothetical protein